MHALYRSKLFENRFKNVSLALLPGFATRIVSAAVWAFLCEVCSIKTFDIRDTVWEVLGRLRHAGECWNVLPQHVSLSFSCYCPFAVP